MISEDIRKGYDFVSRIRNKYLHRLSEDHSNIKIEAVNVFKTSVSTVKNTLGLEIGSSGTVELSARVKNYLKEKNLLVNTSTDVKARLSDLPASELPRDADEFRS